ncbi:MAG: hypothetical protein RIS47_1043, partial [Bacteroidota bacterium]
GGERLPIDKATIIVEDNLQDIENKLVPVDGKALSYTMGGLKLVNAQPLVLEPFSEIHDSRYSIYWLALSNDKYRAYLDSLAALEVEKLALQTRTVDFVAPGEQQPEADHFMQKENSNTGNLEDEFWRDAANEGYFSYQMSTNAEENLTLMVRYWGAEWGNRKFDILIDDQRLVSVDNTFKWNQSKFQDVEYAVPNTMVEGKKQIRLKFQSTTGNSVSSVFYVRLIRNKKQ